MYSFEFGRSKLDLLKYWTTFILLSSFIEGAFSFDCYTCTYTLTSDPSINYECVDQPWNFTRGSPVLPCNNDQFCVTKAIYELDRTTVRSVDRRCRRPETFACGQNCCDENFYNVVCQYQCEGTDTICNSRDVSKAPCGATCSGATEVNISFACLFLVVFIFLCSK